MSAPDVTARALRLYRDAIVIDTHNDMPSKMLDEGYDPAVLHPAGFADRIEGNTDIPRLMTSGLSAVFMSAWVDAPYAATPGASFDRAIKYVDAIHGLVDAHPAQLRFATTAADLRRAKQEGKVAIFIGVEGGHAIESSIERLRALHARGVRYMTLTWNNGNAWAGSSIGADGTRTGGLTPFGRDVIREMNRLGMFVDLSHVSDSTFFDAIAVSTAPVIASHSSARAIDDVPRNLSDDQLRAISKNGGVVNINFYSRFLDPAYRDAVDRAERTLGDERRAAMAAAGADSSALRATLARRRTELMAAVPP
ncbi:MAG: membrane dipeptidase, partial [Gemmatimonadaceae bacterium]|nr:membrane dipeptidase [Gemmatimonadaceae bacterium]